MELDLAKMRVRSLSVLSHNKSATAQARAKLAANFHKSLTPTPSLCSPDSAGAEGGTIVPIKR